ncbi:GNAT family N-acetyltransferase [Angustibacter aerolatus]
MSTSAHTVVRLGPEHQEEVLRLDQWGFVFGEADLLEDLFFFEWDRTFGVRAPDGTLAGLNTTFSLGLTVPDGVGGAGVRTVPMAGLSWVAVHPGQRRRGVLRAMMTDHLHGLHERGEEAVAGLHASEAVIYQRYGYGLATTGLRLTLGRAPELFPVAGSDEVQVSYETASVERHADLVHDVYERACRTRPGAVPRPAHFARVELLDLDVRRGDVEPMRLLVARRDGTPTGYALLRRKVDWKDGNPDGVTTVFALESVDTPTAHALWTRVTDFDLSSSTLTPPVPVDDPLLRLLVDARTPRARAGDELWLRLIDVDRALAQRTYAHDVDVVLDVSDALCPWNARRWRLSGGPDGATCTPTSDPADVEVDVKQLGAAYAGGAPLAALARAGLVTERTPGTLARLSTALRAAVEPGGGWAF